MTAVMIIGMHRSGTSLITRVLNLAGAYLGEQEELLPNSPWNTAGYWENRAFMDLNDGLLRRLGGEWFDPPLLPEGWLEDEAIQALVADSRTFLADKFLPHSLWAVKDPRATILLPFWRRLIDRPRFLFCMRNPLDIALSLANRNEIGIAHATALWHLYTLRALLDTDPSERMTVFYEEFLRDSKPHIESLLAFVDAADCLTEPDVTAAIDRFVDRGLEHHHHTLSELREHPQVLTSTKHLYEAILQRDDRAIQEALRDADGTLEILHTITHSNAQLLEARQEVHHLRQENAQLQECREVLNTRSHRMATAASLWINKLRPRRKIAPLP